MEKQPMWQEWMMLCAIMVDFDFRERAAGRRAESLKMDRREAAT